MNTTSSPSAQPKNKSFYAHPLIVGSAMLTIAYALGCWRVAAPIWFAETSPDPGDFGSLLSGVFAPVAFLWVVVAVILQSSELASQREELKLTRLEFEQNREVLKGQVEESRRQADYISTQTSILNAQFEEQKLSRAVAEAQGLRHAALNLMKGHLASFRWVHKHTSEAFVAFSYDHARTESENLRTFRLTLQSAMTQQIMPETDVEAVRLLVRIGELFLENYPSLPIREKALLDTMEMAGLAETLIAFAGTARLKWGKFTDASF